MLDRGIKAVAMPISSAARSLLMVRSREKLRPLKADFNGTASAASSGPELAF